MKILIAGDLHCNFQAAKSLREVEARERPDFVMQVGDFGYFPQSKYTPHFLRILEKVEAPILFADGNHEDHDALDSAGEGFGFTQLADGIYHVRRGTVLEVDDGTRFLFFGGARSVDRTYRTPGKSWFATELPSEEQWEFAMASTDVDYVIAHDVPSWVDFGYPPIGHPDSPWPDLDLHVSHNFRLRLSDLARAVEPEIWFGGHHHVRKSVPADELRPVRTEVLNCDGYAGTFVILDSQTGEVKEVA